MLNNLLYAPALVFVVSLTGKNIVGTNIYSYFISLLRSLITPVDSFCKSASLQV